MERVWQPAKDSEASILRGNWCIADNFEEISCLECTKHTRILRPRAWAGDSLQSGSLSSRGESSNCEGAQIAVNVGTNEPWRTEIDPRFVSLALDGKVLVLENKDWIKDANTKDVLTNRKNKF